MKYNVPYGLADETTLYSVPYTNGNPSTGTMGSIPPAASIEYDQREIVAVIQWAYDHGFYDYASQLCQAPTNADLTQLLKAIYGIANSRLLTAPREYWVDGTAGNDANDGLSPGKAFKTLQKAQDTIVKYNLNGFNITIHVGPGTYPPLYAGSIGGYGTVSWIGNETTPSNCTIAATAPGPAVLVTGAGDYRFYGFKVSALQDAPGVDAAGFYVWGTGGINLYNIEFGYCKSEHMLAVNGGYIGVQNGKILVSGSAGTAHASTGSGGRILHLTLNSPILTITTPVSMAYWAFASGASNQQFKYTAIANPGFVTAMKYNAVQNSIVDSTGGGINYLPGNVAGTQSSGGQYT